MTKIDFDALVSSARFANPVWFGLDSDCPPTDSDLVQAEAILNLKFPKQYNYFLRKYGGGDFAFTNIFSLDKESDWNLLRIYNDIGLLCDQFLAISDNGTGDYYGFIVEDGCCLESIYFYDHEEQQINPTDYEDLFSYLAQIGLRYP